MVKYLQNFDLLTTEPTFLHNLPCPMAVEPIICVSGVGVGVIAAEVIASPRILKKYIVVNIIDIVKYMVKTRYRHIYDEKVSSNIW